MTQQDFEEMLDRVNRRYQDDARRDYQDSLLAEMNTPSYWEGRIELLEREREFFNKKRGWSAADILCVDRIDAQIQECENEIARIESDDDYEYDQPIAAY
jgi:hypothetical protein